VDSGVVRSSFSVWGLLLNCSIERVCTAKLGEFCQKKIDLFLIGQDMFLVMGSGTWLSEISEFVSAKT
jgi:hypothetical protein